MVSARSATWVDTGISLESGQSATIKVVSGNGTCHVPDDYGCVTGQSQRVGSTPLCSDMSDQVAGPAGPNIPWGAIVARIGATGRPFLIGAGVTVHGEGHVYLIYNDCGTGPVGSGYRDNGGAFTVSVETGFKLSGKILAVACGQNATSCSSRPSPVAGVTVTASGASSGTATTNSKGEYTLTLPEGKYRITPRDGDRAFAPDSLTTDLKGDTGGFDFKTCAAPEIKNDKRQTASAGGVYYIGEGGSGFCKHSFSLKLAGDTVYLAAWTFPYKCTGSSKLTRTATGEAGDSGVVSNSKGTFIIAMSYRGFKAHIAGSVTGSTITVTSAHIAFDNAPPGCPSEVNLNGTVTLKKS